MKIEDCKVVLIAVALAAGFQGFILGWFARADRKGSK